MVRDLRENSMAIIMEFHLDLVHRISLLYAYGYSSKHRQTGGSRGGYDVLHSPEGPPLAPAHLKLKGDAALTVCMYSSVSPEIPSFYDGLQTR